MKLFFLFPPKKSHSFENVAIKYLPILAITIFATTYSYSQDELIDDDADGIPDQYEVEGASWWGLPLYEWGARPGVKDIFIEIDYMDPYGTDGDYDRGLVPMESALIAIRDEFQNIADDPEFGELYSVKLHFDVGDLYDQALGINPERFDLGGGNQVDYAHTVSFDGSADKHVINDYYNNPQVFNPWRKKIFYYMLFANTTPNGGSGQALYRGPVSTVTLGQLYLSTTTLQSRQGKTILHELGHNLGLHHTPKIGKDYNFIYTSVMNYFYLFKDVFQGVAYHNGDFINQAPHCEHDVVLGPVTFGLVSSFSTDDSFPIYGGRSIHEAWIDEDEVQVDVNCDGIIDDSNNTYEVDLDGDGEQSFQVSSNDYKLFYFYFADPNRTLPEDSELALELAMPPF